MPFMSTAPAHSVSVRHWTHWAGIPVKLQSGVVGSAAAHCALLVQVMTQLLFAQTMPVPQWLSVRHSSQLSLGKPAMFMPTVSQ